MEFLKVNQNLCMRDGICAQECPVNIIFLNDSTRFPEAVNGAEEKCIKCGHCVSVCPHEALSLDEIKPEDCAPYKSEFLITNDQIEQLIKHRRSIRNFKDKLVDRPILEKLIDIARYAPTGGNSQMVEWLVYDKPETVKILASKVMDFFRILADKNHPLKERYNIDSLVKRWEAGIDIIFRGAPVLVLTHAPKKHAIATIDNTIAISYLDLAANNFGLGTCWAGFFMIAALQSPEIIQYLNLPEGNACTGALMIGYSKYDYHRIPPRKGAQVIWRD